MPDVFVAKAFDFNNDDIVAQCEAIDSSIFQLHRVKGWSQIGDQEFLSILYETDGTPTSRLICRKFPDLSTDADSIENDTVIQNFINNNVILDIKFVGDYAVIEYR